MAAVAIVPAVLLAAEVVAVTCSYTFLATQSTLHLLTQLTQLPSEGGIITNVHFTIVPITFGIISVSTDANLVYAGSSSISLRLRSSHLIPQTPLTSAKAPEPLPSRRSL